MRDFTSLVANEGIDKAADLVLRARRHVAQVKKVLGWAEREVNTNRYYEDADEIGKEHGLSRDEVKALRRDAKAVNVPVITRRQQLRQELTAALKSEMIAEAILISVVSAAMATPLDPLPLDPEVEAMRHRGEES
jgi:hypothetical protein